MIPGIAPPDFVFMINKPKSIFYPISDAPLNLKLDSCVFVSVSALPAL